MPHVRIQRRPTAVEEFDAQPLQSIKRQFARYYHVPQGGPNLLWPCQNVLAAHEVLEAGDENDLGQLAGAAAKENPKGVPGLVETVRVASLKFEDVRTLVCVLRLHVDITLAVHKQQRVSVDVGRHRQKWCVSFQCECHQLVNGFGIGLEAVGILVPTIHEPMMVCLEEHRIGGQHVVVVAHLRKLRVHVAPSVRHLHLNDLEGHLGQRRAAFVIFEVTRVHLVQHDERDQRRQTGRDILDPLDVFAVPGDHHVNVRLRWRRISWRQ
mmetsp:Transcript_118434/g.377512  ORF Transcript_118434/g.377512 Transcript_118434/m.377512 type:complete len:267 (+) Transcript_118434:163-963(+)